MANYTFETITDDQASSFNGTTDSLIFSDQGANNTNLKAGYVFNPGDATHPTSYSFVITDENDGVSKTFGPDAFPTTASFLGGELITGALGGNTGAGTIVDSSATADAIFSGPGADSVDASGHTGSSLWVQGGQGADTILGGTGNDTLYGGQDNDVITVNAAETGHGFVNGNVGDDTITAYGSTGDTLYGGQGDDLIQVHAANDLINGNIGNDTITATGGTSTLYGGQGDDVISATGGTNDLINGNIGNDTITFTATAGTSTIHGGQGDDVITVHGSVGSYITGDMGADYITVDGTGNDTILGGDGNDTIVASGATSYYIDGGTGDNTITVTHSAAATGDTITAGDGANQITVNLGGISGNDLITAGDGNDTITISGTYAGNDTIVVGNGADSIDVHQHTGAESIMAGNGSDTILGGAGADTIIAGDGNDHITLVGSSGVVEHVTVGAGHDTIDAGIGQDIITKSASGTDAINLGGHSSYLQGSADQIIGWNGSGDTIDFGLSVPVTAFVDTTPHTAVTDYTSAMNEANFQFDHNVQNVVALQVGTDVVVFADMDHSGALNAGDQAVVLVGRSLTDIHASNIVG